MITSIEIKNFKSTENLVLKLKRFNVLIGENGSGKSTILEAICLASAAKGRSIEGSILTSKGVRVTPPQTMRSAFKSRAAKSIVVTVSDNADRKIMYRFNNDNKPFSQWEVEKAVPLHKEIPYSKDFFNYFKFQLFDDMSNVEKKHVTFDVGPVKHNVKPEMIEYIKRVYKPLFKLETIISESDKDKIVESLISIVFKEHTMHYLAELSDFTIYSPENTSLRSFESDENDKPLGNKGQGIFQLIQLISLSKRKSKLSELKELMSLIDWFEDFDVPKDLFATETRINVRDRFMRTAKKFFDQRSVNEGFLFLLFYFTLFISEETPCFFAIDNIENSLNPKLCTRLIKALYSLSVKHNKQVIITTHSAAVLDGLDLNDDNQMLHVVYRNNDGQTKTRRINNPEPVEGQHKPRLSELFLKGAIGGLPKNF